MAGILLFMVHLNGKSFMKHEAKNKKGTHKPEHTNPDMAAENEVQPAAQEEVSLPDAGVEKLEEELKACTEKNAELQDKYLRLSAEFDNYRKRTMKEKTDMIRTAADDVLKKIIPVMDDFERGLAAINSARDLEAVKQGMNLIYGRFKEFLQQQGIKEIEAINQEFNTDFHEAVTKIPVTDESMKGKVVDVVEKGYFLHDKVIRYPKVVVGE
jgi:molecular chaperone GrpE